MPAPLSSGRVPPAMRPSCLPAPATPRIRGWRTSPSAGPRDRSRSARRRAPSERPSGTGCSGSRPSWVPRPPSPAAAPSPADRPAQGGARRSNARAGSERYALALRPRPKTSPPIAKPSPNVPMTKPPTASALRHFDSRSQRPRASVSSGESDSPRRRLRSAAPARRPRYMSSNTSTDSVGIERNYRDRGGRPRTRRRSPQVALPEPEHPGNVAVQDAAPGQRNERVDGAPRRGGAREEDEVGAGDHGPS